MVEKKRPSPFKIVGTLPDWAIKAHIREGLIKIDPLPEDWDDPEKGIVSQVTIDLRLGHKIRRFKALTHEIIDTKFITSKEMDELTEEIELHDNQPLVLGERDFVIATTLERLTLPDNIVGYLHGKSRFARIRISAQVTAPRFDPGWDGHPVLEIGSDLLGAIILLYPGERFCAFHFDRLAASVDIPYMNKPRRTYGGHNSPEPPRFSN